jgi:hypothetical protein
MTASSNHGSNAAIAAVAATADAALRPYDVLCGRSAFALNNVGNRRFRVTVSMALNKYLTTPTRTGKTKVIDSIVDTVRRSGGRFLKWRHARWVELDMKQAREKVGHALRDMSGAIKRDESFFPAVPSIHLSFSREAAASLVRRSKFSERPASVREHSVQKGQGNLPGSCDDSEASSYSHSSTSSSAGGSAESINVIPRSLPLEAGVEPDPLSPLDGFSSALLDDDDVMTRLLDLLEKSELLDFE